MGTDHHIDLLRHGVERMAEARANPDAGTWVVIAVVPMSGTGPVASPMLGGSTRFTMRRFATAEEAIANSVAMPAAKGWGGWALNIISGETVPISPYTSQVVP